MIFITQPRVGASFNEILALQVAARELGWDVFSAPSSWRLDEDLIKSGVKGAPYGSQIFCEVIAQQMGWKLKQNSFDWLAKLPQYYLKRNVEFMTLSDARKITERKFIKPADDKCFEAKVYEPGTFSPSHLIDKTCPVLVSDPVIFDLEYRTFVDDGKTYNKVKTLSCYICYDNMADPKYWYMAPMDEGQSPNDFVDDLLAVISADVGGFGHHASVIDVGRIKGKGWAIIETNPAWASGIYGCDPIEVIKVIERSVE